MFLPDTRNVGGGCSALLACYLSVNTQCVRSALTRIDPPYPSNTPAMLTHSRRWSPLFVTGRAQIIEAHAQHAERLHKVSHGRRRRRKLPASYALAAACDVTDTSGSNVFAVDVL